MLTNLQPLLTFLNHCEKNGAWMNQGLDIKGKGTTHFKFWTFQSELLIAMKEPTGLLPKCEPDYYCLKRNIEGDDGVLEQQQQKSILGKSYNNQGYHFLFIVYQNIYETHLHQFL